MKKIVALLFATLIAAAISYAEEDPSYVGTWAVSTEFMEGKTDLTIFQINPDHSVFYSSQWFFAGKENPGLDNKYVSTWKEAGEGAFCIVLPDGNSSDEYTLETENKLISPSGLFYSRVGDIPFEYFSLITEKDEDKDVDLNPVGKWSFYWDARELNKLLGSKRMSFDIQSYDLFLLDNGAAFMQRAIVKNGKEDFSADMLSGLWIGDAADLTIRVADLTYKAWISSDGRLFLKMTDQMASIYNKTPFYNYEEGFLD